MMNKGQRKAMAARHEQSTIACNGYSKRDERALSRANARHKKAQRSFKQQACGDIDYMMSLWGEGEE